MSTSASFAAVDLGATSGRVVLGRVGPGTLQLREIARFPNTAVRITDGLHWNMLELHRSIFDGLAAAVRLEPQLASIGIDSWAVDYALLRHGRMLGNPYSHRDDRIASGVDAVHAIASPRELYARNGLQHLPFNTLFQLAADRLTGDLDTADRMLLIPDLLAYWLTGIQIAERTNASTTGLLDVTTGQWDVDLASRLSIPNTLLAPLVNPGTELGPLTALADTRAVVTAVGSHDTASAIVAIPATEPGVAYISCGTWSLVGVELPHPILTEEARLAGFTNERGVDDRIRFLHNVMGLWMLTECVRDWEGDGDTIDLSALLAHAAAIDTTMPLFDANDPAFLAPGGMPGRICAWFRERGEAAPTSRAELARSIIASLAAAHARAIHAAAELSGTHVHAVHIVGGGSRNALLCQLTADATGLPVLAGPAEATSIGNLLVQARAHGALNGDLETLRAAVAAAFPPARYEPR